MDAWPRHVHDDVSRLSRLDGDPDRGGERRRRQAAPTRRWSQDGVSAGRHHHLRRDRSAPALRCRLRRKRRRRGFILDAPYTSIVEVAARALPVAAGSAACCRTATRACRHIGNVHVPLLIVHGEPTTSFRWRWGGLHGGERAEGDQTFPGAGHADHYKFGSFEVDQCAGSTGCAAAQSRQVDELANENGPRARRGPFEIPSIGASAAAEATAAETAAKPPPPKPPPPPPP